MKTKKIKNNKVAELIALGIVMLAAPAFAQEQVGNGGGTQFCSKPKNGQLQYEAYDLKEIRDHVVKSRRRIVDLYDGKTTADEYFNRAVEKVKNKSPKLAGAIERSREFYRSKVQSSTSAKLNQVYDADLFSIDQECEYKQLVNWIEPEEMQKRFGVKELLILRDDQVYKNMNPLHQAANDFHEAAYRVRRAFGLDDESGSNFVRMFTGQAFSSGEIDDDLFQQMSLYDRVEWKGERVFVTSVPCAERVNYQVTNMGEKVLKTYGTDLYGAFYVALKIKPGKKVNLDGVNNVMFYHGPIVPLLDSSLSLKLEVGGTFNNFVKTKPVMVKVEAETCGEVFYDNYIIKDNNSTDERNYRVISSPI